MFAVARDSCEQMLQQIPCCLALKVHDFWLTAINLIIRKTVAISVTDANILALAEAGQPLFAYLCGGVS